MKILLGPAGSPAKSTLEGVKAVHDLGLHTMEVAFTHGVRMSNELAKKVGEEARRYDVQLSIHAPYYINLASSDRSIVEASKRRILESCERGHNMGAKRVVFHAAYYASKKDDTFNLVKKEVDVLLAEVDNNGWKTELCPETMGRISQFGDLDEVIRLADETGCSFCVDPAHIYARNLGKIDFPEMFDKLGKKDIHFHFSGINFGPKGERNHLVLESRKPDFQIFAGELLKRKINATIISESPITWKDSMNMKKALLALGFKF